MSKENTFPLFYKEGVCSLKAGLRLEELQEVGEEGRTRDQSDKIKI